MRRRRTETKTVRKREEIKEARKEELVRREEERGKRWRWEGWKRRGEDY